MTNQNPELHVLRLPNNHGDLRMRIEFYADEIKMHLTAPPVALSGPRKIRRLANAWIKKCSKKLHADPRPFYTTFDSGGVRLSQLNKCGIHEQPLIGISILPGGAQ